MNLIVFLEVIIVIICYIFVVMNVIYVYFGFICGKVWWVYFIIYLWIVFGKVLFIVIVFVWLYFVIGEIRVECVVINYFGVEEWMLLLFVVIWLCC